MPDYSKAKIYTIRCNYDDTKIYVGSTTQLLSRRWAKHKYDSKKQLNRLIYQTIDNNWDDWYIELHENYPCNDVYELKKREGEVIRQIATLNMLIAGRTIQEYYHENADKFKEYQKNNAEKIKENKKNYYENNIEKFKENKKKYYENNAEKFKEYQKEYQKNNAEEIKEYQKKYYENNVDKIKQYQKEYREKKKKQEKNLILN